MSQKNIFLADMANVRSAVASRAANAIKASAKHTARRVMRHENKAATALELKLMAEDARAAMTGRMATEIKIGFDTRKRNIVARLAATRESFLAFAEQQCIPLASRVEIEIESNGTKFVLASCAI